MYITKPERERERERWMDILSGRHFQSFLNFLRNENFFGKRSVYDDLDITKGNILFKINRK